MFWLVGFIAAAMLTFAVVSGAREITVYRKALRGEVEYLVSKKRLKRRLLISAILTIESVLLFAGFFLLAPRSPEIELLYWLPALVLIFFLISLTMQDFRETRQDIDRIFREARDTARKSIERNRN